MAPVPKPGILDISPYVAGKSQAKGAKTERIIKLSSNETPLGPSPRAMAAYVLQTGKLARYPDPSQKELREAIGDMYKIPAEQIVCGQGSDELIGLLIAAYAGAGDEVVYTEYGFLMYKIYTQAHGATPVVAKESGLRADVDAILAAVTKKTKIIFLANPNNPTGSYVTKAELKRLRDGLPPHVLLVVDAAYAEYVTLADYSNGQELVAATDNTVMLRTFSKIYGLASIRLGWCYAPPAIVDALNRIRGPFNVSGPALSAGAEAARDGEHIDTARLHNNHWLPWLEKELAALGLKVHPSVANFLLVEFVPRASCLVPGEKDTKHEARSTRHSLAAAANTHLLEDGIIVRDVVGYGLPNCLRMTVGLAEENQALMESLKAFMQAR